MNERIKRPIKVYIKINSNNEIIDINSEIFIEDLSNWIKIDEGDGDRYSHAQNLYLGSLYDDEGAYKYRYEYNRIVEI